MRNYDDLLAAIARLRYEPATLTRTVTIRIVKQLLYTLARSIRARKAGCFTDDNPDADDDSDFFGTADLKEQEKKLKLLRKKLREIILANPSLN